MVIPIGFIAWLILLGISKIENKEGRAAGYIIFTVIAIIVLVAMNDAGYTLRYR